MAQRDIRNSFFCSHKRHDLLKATKFAFAYHKGHDFKKVTLARKQEIFLSPENVIVFK
jgi:hypothetical protein